ncbi:hypothetical protein GCM10011386_33850 [Parapedobacter defluvii]|uniref:Polysaccharide chain length determinant N-terminal domain-containing protein n=1 Tax=Parapedobacter defluvii TaxID=2045106 RepID=A0ABQ1MFR4_9SPHI|nr:Wzz/FepE/Etk N-terminal domain-containing protein [Parapedobacter defluvii]GGC38974.1 hypothetical protein GCM10011386_33850 [Parapedobacter defluvii]
MATEPMRISEEEELTPKEVIISLQNWIRYLWSKRLLLLISGILGGALGILYAFLKTPQYTATTTFVLEGGESKGGLAQYAGMAAMVGIDLGSNASGLFQGDNILELYKSRTMLSQALLSKTHPDSNELLIERYVTYNDFKNVWQDDPVLAELDFRRKPEELDSQSLRVRDSVLTEFIEAIKKDVLTIEKPDKKLSIIKVEVTSPDEVFSKAFNENLVRRVNDFYIQTKTKRSTDNIATLQHKVDSVQAVMTDAIYSAAKVSDATPNLNPTRQVQRLGPAQKAQFSAEANKAILSQLLQNLELAKMNLVQEQPLIQVVDSPVYPLFVEKLGKVRGLIFGGFLFGFLTLLFLVLQRVYRDIMFGKQPT